VVGKSTAMILKVHRSNFFMGGFIESPSTEDIAGLARKKRLPFVEDLGSGAVVATERIAPIEHEPTPAEVLKRGVDLVCFSGDKLLGGPQAGIIVGKAKLVAALKREPFYRTLRCDKLILCALQTTVDLYLEQQSSSSSLSSSSAAIPVISMLDGSRDELHTRAEKIVAALADLTLKASIGDGKAQIGGGTLPRSIIPSVTVDLSPTTGRLEELATRLRENSPPVIGYVSAGRFKLDLRTIFPRQDEEIIQAIRAICL
jgi:L-seryl-tRNA(Ser) seleniumtransferase